MWILSGICKVWLKMEKKNVRNILDGKRGTYVKWGRVWLEDRSGNRKILSQNISCNIVKIYRTNRIMWIICVILKKFGKIFLKKILSERKLLLLLVLLHLFCRIRLSLVSKVFNVNPYRRSYISYRETSIPVSNDHLPSTLLKLSGVRDKITYRRIRSLKTGSKLYNLDNVDPLSPNVVYFLCSGWDNFKLSISILDRIGHPCENLSRFRKQDYKVLQNDPVSNFS